MTSGRHTAFISYRHVDRDRRWAKWLVNKLESYRVPKALIHQGYPARIGKLFRDDDEIPASADLSHQIDAALDASDFLIVICSPDTPVSRWVGQEITRFQEAGKGDRIFALLVAGEPAESFPERLRSIEVEVEDGSGGTRIERREVEPIAADIRPRSDEPKRDTERRAMLRIVAGLLGCPYDALVQRDEQRNRLRQQRIAMASGVAAVVFACLAGLAAWQWRVAVEAQKAEAIALAQAEDALTAATDAANTMVTELAVEFEDRSLPSAVVRSILERAQDLQTTLMDGAPDKPELQDGFVSALAELGDVYLRQDDLQLALEAYQTVLDHRITVLDRNPEDPKAKRDVLSALWRLGRAQVRAGNLDDALQNYTYAAELSEALVALEPEAVRSLTDAAGVREAIGTVELEMNDLEAAVTTYLSALGYARQASALESDNNELRHDVAVLLHSLGLALSRTGSTASPDFAISAFDEAVEIMRELVTSDPNNTRSRSLLISLLQAYGDTLLAKGDNSGSLSLFEEGLAYQQDLNRIDPDNREGLHNVGVMYVKIGTIQAMMGNYTLAQETVQSAVDSFQTLLGLDPGNPLWIRAASIGHQMLGRVQMDAGDTGAARASLREARSYSVSLLDIDPESVSWRIGFVATNYYLSLVSKDSTARALLGESLEVLEAMEEDGDLLDLHGAWFVNIEQRLTALE